MESICNSYILWFVGVLCDIVKTGGKCRGMKHAGNLRQPHNLGAVSNYECLQKSVKTDNRSFLKDFYPDEIERETMVTYRDSNNNKVKMIVSRVTLNAVLN